MKKTNELTNWVISRIENEYKDDIALLIALHGHTTDDDQHGVCFDYFVPATERGNELSETFIIDGVGHDLYPRSWERLEESVNLNDMPIILDGAEILYARSKEDEDRNYPKNIVFLMTPFGEYCTDENGPLTPSPRSTKSKNKWRKK